MPIQQAHIPSPVGPQTTAGKRKKMRRRQETKGQRRPTTAEGGQVKGPRKTRLPDSENLAPQKQARPQSQEERLYPGSEAVVMWERVSP